jgi:hypothetical protein
LLLAYWCLLSTVLWSLCILRALSENNSAVFIFKVRILLRVYNQHIQIPLPTQQFFINVYSTTCFGPNGPSSGATSLAHSTTELQISHSHLYTYG